MSSLAFLTAWMGMNFHGNLPEDRISRNLKDRPPYERILDVDIGPENAHAGVIDDGYVCIAWCPIDPKQNPERYRIFYCKEDYILADPQNFSIDPLEGGSPQNVKNWEYIDVPAGDPPEITIRGLEVGKIYHFTAKTIDKFGKQSIGLSKNEPIATAAIVGNCYREGASANRVDAYDYYKLKAAFGSREGDENWSINCDFNNDGWVDSKDYNTLLTNWGVIQRNDMGTEYSDDSKIVEDGPCEEF